jgi:predicted enzyme related to lactoylglutathione lyase
MPRTLEARSSVDVMGPIFVHAVTVDCLDAETMATFWTALLGVEVRGRWKEYVGLTPPAAGHPRMLFQQVAGPLPDRRTTHVDLHVDDLEVATARVLELGGTVVADHRYDETRWRVMADPEGNPFCLVPE